MSSSNISTSTLTFLLSILVISYFIMLGKSYDIVFLSKSAYKIEYLSVLDDAFKKYKSDYSNLYYFLTKYIDTDNL